MAAGGKHPDFEGVVIQQVTSSRSCSGDLLQGRYQRSLTTPTCIPKTPEPPPTPNFPLRHLSQSRATPCGATRTSSTRHPKIDYLLKSKGHPYYVPCDVKSPAPPLGHVTSSELPFKDRPAGTCFSGLSEPSVNMWLLNPFCCLMQVIFLGLAGAATFGAPDFVRAAVKSPASEFLLQWARRAQPQHVATEYFLLPCAGQNKPTNETAALRTQQTEMIKLISDMALRYTELQKRAAVVDALEKTVNFLQAKITEMKDQRRL
ncbi:hypothetical protein V5799_004150 [Amblyomma americanum]|uniref:Uncharacterized protein n=1 Tax=Amblyomma americanum TaxID=6943 RepID=A0AAQ4D6X7_AMBAM